MKAYKKLMDVLAMLEKIALVVSTIIILVLTVGNVFSRKSFTSHGRLRRNWLLPYSS